MTLLIKNVQIIGSDQKLPDRLDVFVSGERITALGRFPGKSADKIIDGQGGYLAPGFIDVHSESDHYLSIFTHPSQDDFLKQGVTTTIGGLCGTSLAPLIYGSLESIEEWTDPKQINVDWHSLKEFLKILEKKPLGVNFGTLVGHSTIRQAIIGTPPRNPTKNELLVIKETLKRSLEEGGFGLSTGLGYVASRETTYSELKQLASLVKELGGVYATHLRKESEALGESVDETIKLSEETGVSTIVSHLIPTQRHEKEYEDVISRIDALPQTADLHFSLYPSQTRILKLYTFLPVWAQKDDIKVMAMSLKDEWLRSKIEKELPEVNPKDFVVAQAVDNNSLVGYTLADLKKLYSLKSYRETLLKLMQTTNLQAIIFYKNIKSELLMEAIRSPRSLIVSNSASLEDDPKLKTLKPDRAISTFTKFLSLIENEKVMSLEEAIKKITLTPAKKFGLKERGVVKEGYFADLVIFKNSEVNSVVVNGQVAVENGAYTGTRSGKILRRRT